jgi:protein-disulfide isomerase
MTNAVLPILADDHARGPADALLVIVQYGDYDCPHTRASASIIRAIKDELPTRPRFVFRHFPLRHLHANAQILSEIAESAATLGHFWDVHERLMGHQRGITQHDVLDDLRNASIDVEALQRLLGTAPITARIERDVQAGTAMGVHSTPTWFFDGARWDGHYDRDTLLGRVRAALASHAG